MKKSTVLFAVILLFLTVVFPARGIKDPPGAGHLVYGAIGEPDTLDPAWGYDIASGELIFNVYEGLLFFDGESVEEYRAQLAADYIVEDTNETDSETGLTWMARYTFTIRTGVQFHSGGILAPSDVEYSFERGMVQDRTGGPEWMFLLPLLNVWYTREYNLSDPAEAELVGKMIDHAVQSNSTHVWLNAVSKVEWFWQVLCQSWASVISQAWAVGIGDWPGTWGDYTGWVAYNDPATSPIDLLATYPTGQDGGTGPFKLDYWNKGVEWSIVRFADYWDGWPALRPAPGGIAPFSYVERFTEKFIMDWAVRKPLFIGGDLDLCYIPRSYINDPDLLAAVASGAIELVKPLPMLSLVSFHFNFAVGFDSPYMPEMPIGTPRFDLFSDVHMRRGFAYAFNYTDFIDVAYLNEAIHPGSWHIEGLASHSIPHRYSIDLAKAADEFKLAFGGTLESPGPAWTQGFTVHIVYAASTVRQFMCEMFEYYIEKLYTDFGAPGTVDVRPVVLPWILFMEIDPTWLPAYSLGWLADFAHPDNFARPYMHSQGDFAYFQSYNNATVDMMIDTAVKLPLSDPTAQAYYWELQLEFYRSVPTIPMIQAIGRHYEQAWVQGWYYNPLHPGFYVYSIWKQDVTAGNVNCDGVVDMRDIGAIGRAFGSYPGHSRWNFRCDLNGDRKIDMRDISTAARNFGKP